MEKNHLEPFLSTSHLKQVRLKEKDRIKIEEFVDRGMGTWEQGISALILLESVQAMEPVIKNSHHLMLQNMNSDKVDWELCQIFLENSHNLIYFTLQADEIIHVVKKILPKALSAQKYNIIVQCYLVMSLLHLKESLSEIALEESKLAHFYLQKTPYLDEALTFKVQLQIVLAHVLGGNLYEADYKIKEFKWDIYNKDALHTEIFMQVIHTLICLRKGHISVGEVLLSSLFPKIAEHTDFQYRQLFNQIFIDTIALYEKELSSKSKQHLLEKCEEINRSTEYIKQLINDVEKNMEQQKDLYSYLLNKNYLFQHGQQVLEATKRNGEMLICTVVECDVYKMPLSKQQLLLDQFVLLTYFIGKQRHFICQYNKEICIIVATVSKIQAANVKTYIETIFDNKVPHYSYVYSGCCEIVENFHQLVSYTYLKKFYKLPLEK